jgi:Zn-dependent M28 family amino/carboxypeptidase
VLLLAHADGWFSAAADNGGGAAAVLRAARLLAERPPAGTGVVVALVDGEEVGYVGSAALAAALRSPRGLPVGDGGPPLRMDDLVAVVNLDAPSARASDAQAVPRSVVGADVPVFQWRVLVTSEVPGLAAVAQAAFAAHGVHALPVPSRGALAVNGSWRTDAGFFHAAGVPVVWPVAGYPEYHTTGDTLAAVDPVDLEGVAEGAADVARLLALAPPARVPDAFR